MRAVMVGLLCFSLTACDGGSGDEGTDDLTPPSTNPEIVSFGPVTPAVPRDQAVELMWEVKNARSITIFSATEILVTTDQLEGTVMTLPLRSKSSFTLRATGSGPAVGQVTEVEVIWPEPTIELFKAEPETTFINNVTTLSWRTDDVERVRILSNGLEVPGGSFMGAAARASSLTVQVMSASTTYTLEAINPTHTRTDDVVVFAEEPPTIRSFTAHPRTFVETSTHTTLRWDTTGFERLELMANFVPVPGFRQDVLSGSFQLDVFQTTDFALVGYVNGFAYTQLDVIVARPAFEYEPNDDPGFANYITYEGGAQGTIDTVTDVDYYLLDVYYPSNLRIWVRGYNGGCPVDTSIELLRAFPDMPLLTDEDDGIPTGRGGACPEIHPDRDELVRDISGSFFIVVRGQRNETGEYVLMTEFTD